MSALALNKKMLLEAGWLRENCAECLSASCPDCGSPIDLRVGDPSIPEKECSVCLCKAIPVLQCSKCSQAVVSAMEGVERQCQSVYAYENGRGATFQPDGEVWFHRKTATGKILCTLENELRESLTSGALTPSTLVCPFGGDSFKKAMDHPSFSAFLAHHSEEAVSAHPSSPAAVPSPVPPVSVPIPAIARKTRIAIAWAAVLGPIGLLYVSWRMSMVSLLLHVVSCAILGWPIWAVVTVWHGVPILIAYCKTRDGMSFTGFPALVMKDLRAITSVYPIIEKFAHSSVGAWISGTIFLSGFLFGGSMKMGQWMGNSNWVAIGLFFILCFCITKISVNISKKYIQSIKTGHDIYFPYPFLTSSGVLKNWLRWSAMGILIFMTCGLWEQNAVLIRLVLIGLTIGLPFTPILKGGIGSFAFGCVGGLMSLLISGIAASVISFVYRIIIK